MGSDSVVVAHLALFRKIAAADGPRKFKNIGTTELAELCILESVLIFKALLTRSLLSISF